MTISKGGLARTLQSACVKRAAIQHVGDQRDGDDGAVTFKVYAHDGGIFEVHVTNYKEAIR